VDDGDYDYIIFGPAIVSFKFFDSESWNQVEDTHHIPEPIKMIIYVLLNASQLIAEAECRNLWARRPRNFKTEFRNEMVLYSEDNKETKYILLELLGEGAHSWVCRARLTEQDQDICIKMVPSTSEPELLNERFILSSILKGVNGVPKVLNFGIMYLKERRKLIALVTDIVGISLKEFAERSLLSRMDIENIWRILLVIFNDIHKRGVVIADFKPEHIILSEDRISIIDFGGAYQIGKTPSRYLLTKMFASLASLNFHSLEPEDDIESLVLSLLYYFDRSAIVWWNRELTDFEDFQFRKKVSKMIKDQIPYKPSLTFLAQKIREIEDFDCEQIT